MGRRFILGFAALCAAGAAHADCPAANQFSFLFNSQPTTTLSNTGIYTYTATSSALGSVNFTVSFAGYNVANTAVAGTTLPAISTLINDDAASRFLVVGGVFAGRTSNIATNANVIVTTFTFPTPVRDVTLTASDLDYGVNQYRDWFQAVGRNGATSYTPTIVTPFGQSNQTNVKTNASSSLTLGPTTTPLSIGASETIGTGTSAADANTGNITLSFSQPITSLELRYGNAPFSNGETATGQQAIGYKGISWCPMPALTLAKTSSPYSDPQNGTTNPKLIPGGDLLYTLTVANSNSSPVDMASVVLTDPLPSGISFYNGDIDDAGPLTSNFAFVPGSSGLTLGAGNIGYSNTAGASYAYAPAAGYDAAVTALRFAPQGIMAANSSFAIQFRARIK